MKMTPFFMAGLVLVLILVIVGCSSQEGGRPDGGEKATAKRAGKTEEHDHGAGPHGGPLAEWGAEDYHVEFIVDHDKQEATVYILGGDAKRPAPINTDKVLLSIKEPAFQVELRPVPQQGDPKGKSSKFVGKHEKFGKEQEFAGTISGELDGKPYAGDFKEEPEGHGHDRLKK